MSEINANIVVQSFGANIAVEENNINITPTDIQLRVFSGGYATPTGNINEVQYNGGGVLAGDPGLKYYPGNTTAVANNLSVTNNSSLGQATAGNLFANTGTVGASLLTGTLTTASQPNITSVGTLGTLTVTGNVTGNYFIGNGSQLTGLDSTSNGNSNIRIFANSNVAVSVAGNANVLVVTDTGANVAGYLNATGNITFAGPNVSVGNVSNLKITGGSNSYFLQTDGTGNLTWAPGTANVSGNGTAAGANTQIQISDGTGNFTSGAGFTFDNASNLFSAPGNANIVGNVTANYFIGNGSQLTGIDSSQIQNGNSNVKTLANSNVTVSVAGNANVVTITGNELIVNGNITSNNANAGNLLTANYISGTLVTAAQPNITSVGNLSSLTVTGNANIANITITGNLSANISRIANGTSNVGIPTANGNIPIYVNGNLAGTFTTNANGQSLQIPDGILIGDTTGVVSTSTRLYGILYTDGNPGHIYAKGSIYSNGQFISNLATGAPPFVINSTTPVSNLNITGNAGYANASNTANSAITANSATIAGTVTTNAQPNITSVGVLTGLSLGTNANILMSGSISRLEGANSFSANFANIAGNLISGNANLGNAARANFFIGDGTYISNISVGAGTEILNGNSNVKVYANSNIAVSVNGTSNTVVFGNTSVVFNNNVTATTLTGTLTTNAQPNITSLGTLANLAVTGTANLGNVANVKILGGSNNQVLRTDGTGNLSWVSGSPTPGGSNTQVQYNDAGVLNGSAGFTFDETKSDITVQGNIFAQSYFVFTIQAGIAANGSAQGNATALTKQFNEVTTVNSGEGVRLPSDKAGSSILIVNTSANTLNVYPAAGAKINALANNIAVTQSANSRVQYFATANNQWYSFTSA